MRQAIGLAEKGMFSTDPNPRVGCIVVKNGRVIGEGWHRLAGGPHAEIVALAAAGTEAKGSTVYVTLEPCCHHGKTPPCSQALIEAGVSRVVAAMQDPNPRVAGSGLKQLRESGIETACGLLSEDAKSLNPGFCRRMTTGRPLIRSKLAMSLDGRTALASGESRWITGEAARFDVHLWRARSSAIITGIQTVLADDPQMTARLPGIELEVVQPVRVILDSRLRFPELSRMLACEGRTVILTAESPRKDRIPAGCEVVTLPTNAGGQMDLDSVMQWLGEQEFNEVLFEAGALLNGALLQQQIVDEWIIYMATIILGDKGRGLFHLPELRHMTDRFSLDLKEMSRIGSDIRLLLKRPDPKDAN